MKKEMEGMSEQIATLQKEIEELKMKESSKDRAESKGAYGKCMWFHYILEEIIG